MGLLRVLHLRGVDAGFRGQVACPEQLLDLVAGRRDGGVRQGDGVGSHVGDEALLVELLGHRHGSLRGEAEFPAGLLLEGGGAERFVGAAGVGPGIHLVDAERGGLEGGGECGGGGLVEDCDGGAGGLTGGVEVAALGDTHPVEGGQACGEGAGFRLGAAVEGHVEVPVAGGHESDAFPFPVNDETGGHGLNATRRQFRHDLLPQHRGDLVAVEAVEDAAGLLRVDEVGVERAGVGDRLGDGRRGDLVEDHAVGGHLGFEFLQQVPGDGLALAVTIGGQEEFVGDLEFLFQLPQRRLLVGGHDVEGGEVVVDVDAGARPFESLVPGGHLGGAGGQVADVTAARLHHVAVAEVAGDLRRLGGRFDYHESLPFVRHGVPASRRPHGNNSPRNNPATSNDPKITVAATTPAHILLGWLRRPPVSVRAEPSP